MQANGWPAGHSRLWPLCFASSVSACVPLRHTQSPHTPCAGWLCTDWHARPGWSCCSSWQQRRQPAAASSRPQPPTASSEEGDEERGMVHCRPQFQCSDARAEEHLAEIEPHELGWESIRKGGRTEYSSQKGRTEIAERIANTETAAPDENRGKQASPEVQQGLRQQLALAGRLSTSSVLLGHPPVPTTPDQAHAPPAPVPGCSGSQTFLPAALWRCTALGGCRRRWCRR